MANEKKNQSQPDTATPETKQAVVDGAALKSGRLRIAGFPAGDFLGVRFNERGESEGAVPARVRAQLETDFAGAEIEEL